MLSGVEFVHRWSLHNLPKGYTQSRRHGGYSNYHHDRYLEQCEQLVPPPANPNATTPVAASENESRAEKVSNQSAKCGEIMQCTEGDSRPSWC